MVNVHEPSLYWNVPVEATAFVGAVSAFAVFLLVLFVYVNKKWGLVSVGVPPGRNSGQKSHRAVPSRSTKDRPLCVPVVTSSNGPTYAYKSVSEEQPHKFGPQPQHGNYEPENQNLLGTNDNPDDLKNRPSPNPSIYRDANMELEDNELEPSEFTPLMSTVIRNGDIYHNSSSQNHNASPVPAPQTIYTRQGQVMPAFGTVGSRPVNMITSRSVDNGYGPRGQIVGGYCRPPLLPQRSFDMGSRTSSPCSSTHSHPHFATSRPLRVSSTLPHAPMANSGSRRRAPHSRLTRSKTEGGNHRTRDLMCLAEAGKVNGGSSASSTSSNDVSEELDPRHPAHISNNPHHGHHTGPTQGPPSSQRSSRRPMLKNVGRAASTGTPNSGRTRLESSNASASMRRALMMPPRTKSLDSESPPPSEQGMSVYTDSLADQDDQIFEVDCDLGIMDGSVVPSGGLPCGRLEVALDYDEPGRKLSLHIIQARDIPPKDVGGANNTQVRVVLLPSRKQKHKTKVRSGENPSFMESFVFNKISPEELGNLSIRVRLYGCEKLRRERLLGETHVSLASIHLDMEATFWINFQPRYHLPWECRSETGSLARSESASSSASMGGGAIPELLIGLAYNGTTGRLTCEIIKGSHFRSLGGGKAPDSYVKLVLLSTNGQELGRAKTSLRRAQSNPLFKETFMFQVALFQMTEVTLLVSIYGRKGVTRRELLGWCALGYNSSSDEAVTHWEDTLDNHGDQLCRWQVLLQS